MRPTESIITIWSAITCGASILAILLAFRGRRIDDHPICRKCGFDLFGLPPTSHNCPECGRDLTRKRAARIGHRRRLKTLLLLGLTFFLASAGWLGFLGVLVVRHEDWNRHKPVAWLVRDAASPLIRDEAVTELIRRLRNNELSDNQISEIANIALAHQANRQGPWFATWEQFIELAHHAKRLTPDRWQRYEQQALNCFELEVRTEVRRGHPVPFRITRLPSRGGPISLWTLQTFPPLIQVDGQVLRTFAVTGSIENGRGPCEGLVAMPPTEVMRFDPGEHQAGVTINFGPYVSRRPPSSEPPFTHQVRATRNFYVTPDTRSSVALHYDAAMDPQIEAAISLEVSADRIQQVMTVILSNAGTPIDLAFRAQLSAGGLERDLGFILFPANRPGNATIPLKDVLQAWDPDEVDIRLVPSLDAAECTLDMTKIWGGQVIRVDVPVVGLAR